LYYLPLYVNANDYDVALKLYDDLKTLNYSGKGTKYFAVKAVNFHWGLFNALPEI
jgi:hypothetical protein